MNARPKSRTAEKCRFLNRTMAAAVEDALVAFHGSRAADSSDGFCDERLWAAIARRIGASRFLDAIDACRAEMCDRAEVLPANDQPAYFQAYLNRHFPKGGVR